MRDKFEEEKKDLLKKAQEDIKSNIPLEKSQKKQLKKMLQFSIMRASANDAVSTSNLKKLSNKIFKKLFVSVLTGDKKKKNISQEDDEESEEFYNENINIDMNLIAANPEKVNLNKVSQKLSPFNIFSRMKASIIAVPTKLILDKLKDLRNQKVNHRETPEEHLERQRTRERQRSRVMVHTRERGGRSY